jgi:hypothetical protein
MVEAVERDIRGASVEREMVAEIAASYGALPQEQTPSASTNAFARLPLDVNRERRRGR